MATKAELKGRITLDNSLFKAGLKNATGMAKSFASTVGSTLKSFITSPLGIIGGALAGIFAFKTFAGGIAGAIQAGAQMKKLSEQTGVTVGTFVTLGKAFKDADVDAELVGSSLAHMQRMLFAADKGSAQAHAALATLHLRFNDIIKLDPGAQFQAIGDRILTIRNATERAGMAMMFFGKAGTQLIPVFREIANTDFGDLSEKAEVMQRNADTFFEIVHGFRRLGTSFRAVYLGIADKIAPALKDILAMVPRINFLHIGQTIGQGIATSYYAIKGFIGHWRQALAEIWEIAKIVFDAIGNYWLALWKIELGGVAKIFQTVFSKSFWVGIWDSMVSAFLDAVKKMLQSFSGLGPGIEKLLGFSPEKAVSNIVTTQSQDEMNRAMLESVKNVPEFRRSGSFSSGVGGFGFGASSGGAGGFKTKEGGFSFNPSTKLSLLQDGLAQVGKANDLFRQAGRRISSLAKAMIAIGSGATRNEISEGMKETWRFFGFGGLTTGHLITPSMAQGFGINTSSLNRGAYGQTNLLRHGELNEIMDKAVASGQARDALSPGGYHAIRRGDHARAREYQREQLRQKLGVEKTNEILSDIDGKMTELQKSMNGEN